MRTPEDRVYKLASKYAAQILDARIFRQQNPSETLGAFASPGILECWRELTSTLSSNAYFKKCSASLQHEIHTGVLRILMDECERTPSSLDDSTVLATRISEALSDLIRQQWLFVMPATVRPGDCTKAPLLFSTAVGGVVALSQVPKDPDGREKLRKSLSEVLEVPSSQLQDGLRDFAGRSILSTLSSGPQLHAFEVGRERVAAARDSIWVACATLDGVDLPVLEGLDSQNFRSPDSLRIDPGVMLYGSGDDLTEDRACSAYMDFRLPGLEQLENERIKHRADQLFAFVDLDAKQIMQPAPQKKASSRSGIWVESVLEKCIRALGMSRDQVDSSARFVFKVMALESLLKTGENEGIAQSVSQAGAMMLSGDLETRATTLESLKVAYHLRSKLIHEATPVWKSVSKHPVPAIEKLVADVVIASLRQVIPQAGKGISMQEYGAILKRFSIGFPWEAAVEHVLHRPPQ